MRIAIRQTTLGVTAAAIALAVAGAIAQQPAAGAAQQPPGGGRQGGGRQGPAPGGFQRPPSLPFPDAAQVVDRDLGYAPPFGPVWDPVHTVARELVRALREQGS